MWRVKSAITSRRLAFACIVLGALVLLGWLLDSTLLKQLSPRFEPMKRETACAFIVLGLGLVTPTMTARWACGLLVAVVMGGVAVLQASRGFALLGLDPKVHTSLATASSMFAAGLALVLLDSGHRYLREVTPWLSVLGGLIGLCGFYGYLFGVADLYKISPFASMALHTSLGLIVVHVAIAFSRPERAFMYLVCGDSAGGRMLRQLLPWYVSAPLAINTLRVAGTYAGVFGPDFGLAVFAVLNIVATVTILGRGAVLLNSFDREKVIAMTKLATEQARQEAADNFRSLIERAPISVFVHRDERLLYANRLAVNDLGYSSPLELLGENLVDKIAHPDQRAPMRRRLAVLAQEGHIATSTSQARCVAKDGREVVFEGGSILIEWEGQKAIATLALNVTEKYWAEQLRKEAENVIRAQLAEKEVLLREIHHRVKNNLQIISSLLNLQANQSMDAATRNALNENQARIRSIASLHEQLYQSKDLANIEMREYVNQLLSNLVRTHGAEYARVRTRALVDNVSLPLDKAVPCGLIINELATNAYKHAFAGVESPEIFIMMYIEESDYFLIFEDNGVGLPQDTEVHRAKSLGLRLVRTLTRQLDGHIAQQPTSRGTSFKLIFPRKLEESVEART